MAFPFRPTPLGRSAVVEPGSDAHLRQLLELLVFTVPGERVMRPELGSPVRQLVFGGLGGPESLALEAALQATVQQWLGHVVDVVDLRVTALEEDAVLEVVLTYESVRTRTTASLALRKDLT